MSDERPGAVRLVVWGLMFGVFFGLHIYFDDGAWWVGVIYGAGAGVLFGFLMLVGFAWTRRRRRPVQQRGWLGRTPVVILGAALVGALQFQESRFDRGQSLQFSVVGAVVMALVVFVGGVVGREIRRRPALATPSRPDVEVP
jgi:hypothetical protein